MGITKRGDKYRVRVYNPQVGTTVHVGTCDKERDAKKLFRDKTEEFAQPRAAKGMTVAEYAERWLEVKHGRGTRRPAATTLAHNRGMLAPFLEAFGSRPLDSIRRDEALDWSTGKNSRARVVAAMYSDAVNEMRATSNPFANRQQPEPEGRRNIVPLREDEVDRLAEIALSHWGPKMYGIVARAWVLFSAWVGSRPGETFRVQWPDLNFAEGLVTVQRVKGGKQTQTIVLPERASAAIAAMPVERVGLVFPTVSGKAMTKGASRYYWDPIRRTFAAELDPHRRAELLDDRLDIDLYELRHHAASIMADRGLNEYDIAHQLGNSPEVCRRVYIHAHRDRTNDRVRAVLNAAPTPSLDAARQRRMRGAS